MAFGVERRELLAAHVGAAARHHHGRVPAQQARRAAEGMQPAELLLQLLIRGRRHDRDHRSGPNAARRSRGFQPEPDLFC